MNWFNENMTKVMSKKILIVGASSGIGFELAKILQEKENTVISASRSRGLLDDLELPISHITYDALNEEELRIESDQLDGLVYCPGSINLKPFHRLSTKDFLEDFQINVLGAVHTIQQCLPLLKKGKDSTILLFSTVAVDQGMPFHSSVASAKGAIEGLTRSLAAELSPGIRVNCIAPSIVDTPLASRILSNDEKKEASAKRHPLGKIGSAKNLAQLASFLLLEQSQWITGQVMHADGGMSTIKKM